MDNTSSVVNDEAEDPAIIDAVTEEEDTLNPMEMMMEDDCQDKDSIDNSHPDNDFCFTEDDFIDSVNNINDATRHRSNYNSIWDQIKALDGVEYVSGDNHKDGPITWKVISACNDDAFGETRKEELKSIADIIQLDSESGDEDDRENKDNNDDYDKIFWRLWPETLEQEIEKMNASIEAANNDAKEIHKRVIREVSTSEFLIFHALLIGATVHFQQGEKLWHSNNTNKRKERKGLSEVVDFGKWMKWLRFKQIKQFVSKVMEDNMMKTTNVDWWQIKNRILKHNFHKRTLLSASHVLIFDESISGYIPRYET